MSAAGRPFLQYQREGNPSCTELSRRRATAGTRSSTKAPTTPVSRSAAGSPLMRARPTPNACLRTSSARSTRVSRSWLTRARSASTSPSGGCPCRNPACGTAPSTRTAATSTGTSYPRESVRHRVLRDGPVQPGPRGHPLDDRRLPLASSPALSARRGFARGLLSRQLRLRRAAPGPARSARPGWRSKVPVGGLRPRLRQSAVATGHNGVGRRRARLRRRVPPAPGTDRPAFTGSRHASACLERPASPGR